MDLQYSLQEGGNVLCLRLVPGIYLDESKLPNIAGVPALAPLSITMENGAQCLKYRITGYQSLSVWLSQHYLSTRDFLQMELGLAESGIEAEKAGVSLQLAEAQQLVFFSGSRGRFLYIPIYGYCGQGLRNVLLEALYSASFAADIQSQYVQEVIGYLQAEAGFSLVGFREFLLRLIHRQEKGSRPEIYDVNRTAIVGVDTYSQEEISALEMSQKYAQEESLRRTEEEARLRAEEEARRQAEEEARLRAEEEARRQAEEEARLRAEEEARRQAEEEARLRAEEEARRQAEEEARLRAEEEARRQAEEEARLRAEEEARRQAEEEARLRAEEEARRQAEEEARLRAEEEARRQAEEEARLRAEEEARRQAEEARLAAVPILYFPRTGQQVRLVNPITRIGKKESLVDFCIPDNNTVSRHHADIVKKGDFYVLIDQGSLNKSYVNGQEAAPGVEIPLYPGDCIVLSDEVLYFQ